MPAFRFVYIKATEGSDFKDSMFADNWHGARQAGIAHGAYHIFTRCSNGLEQARNFVATVSSEPHTLPPAIDITSADSCNESLTVDTPENELRAFAAEIERVYGRGPLYYSSFQPRFYDDFPEADRGRSWVSVFLLHPDFMHGPEWRFWQYSTRGRQNGIDGPVDLNVFNGSEEAFLKMLEN